MRTLRKYTGFFTKIHRFACIFSILFYAATPQIPQAFAQGEEDGTEVLKNSLIAEALEGEFLIRFNSAQGLQSLSASTKPAWLNQLGKGVEIDNKTLSAFNIAHIRLTNPASSGNWENLAKTLSSDPSIAQVEPNYLYRINANIPLDDTYGEELWHLKKISAFKAWEHIPQDNSKDIIVAVVDSGIQLDHEDLKDKIWHNAKEIPGNLEDDDHNGYVDDVTGWNFYDNNQMPYAHLNPYPVASVDPETGRFKCSGHPTKRAYELHGSHVAGIIAATANNKLGVAGVYQNIKIMPVKVMGGPCGYGDTKTILNGVIYAYQNGARIINMSLGGYGYSELAQDVYEQISREGVLIVASAGNSANDNDSKRKNYPASYPVDGILSVAATDAKDDMAEFSNFGKHSVDLAAPGVKILSTAPYDNKGDWPESGYLKLSGTSMAAPVVSGGAAMLLAQNPKLSNLQLKQLLMDSTDKLPNLRELIVSGGRLNLYRALTQRVSVMEQNKRSSLPTSAHPQTEDRSLGGIRIFDHRSKEGKPMKW